MTEEASLQRILRSMLGPSQNEGDHTAERLMPTVATVASLSSSTTPLVTTTSSGQHSTLSPTTKKYDVLGNHPIEVAFFRFLHSELQKSIRFYDRIQQEYTIRVERLVGGSEILQDPDSILVRDRWSVLARSAYNVYKDLLLLQNYAIMTYCSFSKILKKHDKMTNRTTRSAFMTSMVDSANFADTSRLEQMVQSCEEVYNDASARLFMEGRAVLGEDERLFLNMVSQMNNEAVVAAEEEGAPNANRKQRPGLKVGVDSGGEQHQGSQDGVDDSLNKRALFSRRNQSPSGRSIFSSSGDEDESTANEERDCKLPASGDSKTVTRRKSK